MPGIEISERDGRFETSTRPLARRGGRKRERTGPPRRSNAMKTDKTGPEKADQAEQPKLDPSDALVGEQVIHSLGKPPHLLRVQSRRLWAGFYRVNVFVGESTACAKVSN